MQANLFNSDYKVENSKKNLNEVVQNCDKIIVTASALCSPFFKESVKCMIPFLKVYGKSIYLPHSQETQIAIYSNDESNPERMSFASQAIEIINVLKKEGLVKFIGAKDSPKNSLLQLIELIEVMSQRERIMVLTQSVKVYEELESLNVKVARINRFGYLSKMMTAGELKERQLKVELGL
ncbi:hypothetical protein LNN31_12700 [Acetobacterium wieringae]|uniref:Uncharacterized protein n=1 Tax=Acetobacterium wieringae TaxID=52694 RepID=A0ABY6HAU1_9FIRM|nr:hypothetical protein [Acetobacterium wieringae]UYO61613.1 hypothetical protein LNN31_12560 [Acetobacterium wieringae]UYO61639.1 hypothetical protein LNN31_12700 [Acetobacterium wieringae]